jgi:hypothetical protein
MALVAHLIDKDFKLHEQLFFAKPFSEVAHNLVEDEKAIKEGLASSGIGLYNTSKIPIVDTVSKHAIFSTLNIYYIDFNIHGVL